MGCECNCKSDLNSLRNALDANTQAKGHNTIAIEASTEGLGRWEAKDEKYHQDHHEIISAIKTNTEEILKFLKEKR